VATARRHAGRAPEQLLDAIQERAGPGLRVVEEADDSTLEGWNALGQWHGIPGDRSDRPEQADRSHLRDTSLSTGAPATVRAWGPCPVERLAPGEDNTCESTSRRPPGLQHRKGGLAAQHIVRGRVPASDADGADDGDAVEDHETARLGEQASAMRDEQAPEPGLPRLRRHVGGGKG